MKGERLSGVYGESISRQVDKKSGVPREERGVWSSKGGEKDKLFFSTSLSHIKVLFSLSPGADDYATKQLSLNSVLRTVSPS